MTSAQDPKLTGQLLRNAYLALVEAIRVSYDGAAAAAQGDPHAAVMHLHTAAGLVDNAADRLEKAPLLDIWRSANPDPLDDLHTDVLIARADLGRAANAAIRAKEPGAALSTFVPVVVKRTGEATDQISKSLNDLATLWFIAGRAAQADDE